MASIFVKQVIQINEYLGDMIRQKLIYYPTVTRDAYHNMGRITDLLASGKLTSDIGMQAINPQSDRIMICGGPSMLKDTCAILNKMGFLEARNGTAGHYVIERAFVE